MYKRLNVRGIQIITVSDGIVTGTQGSKIHLTIKALVNELYLDDLRAKTHRGLSGRIMRGMSAGGRIFGYKTVIVDEERQTAAKDAIPTRFEIDPDAARIVEQIYRAYARGQGMAMDCARAQQCRRGFSSQRHPQSGDTARMGCICDSRNPPEREIRRRLGVEQDTILKRPGHRPSTPSSTPPSSEWIRQHRPDLRIIDEDLWRSVQERLNVTEEKFGIGPGRPPRGAARLVGSQHLLSGLIRCAICGARMTAQTATRKMAEIVYHYRWYRCGFARSTGPAVCTHGTWYRQDRLEVALIRKFREAMTPRSSMRLYAPQTPKYEGY